MKSKIKMRGFSIVEVLVALVVVAFGIFGAADMLINAQKSAIITEKRMQGNALGQLKLEELRCAFEDLANTNLPDEYETSGTFEQNTAYSWQASVHMAQPQSGLGQISIVITGAANGQQVSKVAGPLARRATPAAAGPG